MNKRVLSSKKQNYVLQKSLLEEQKVLIEKGPSTIILS